MRTWLDIERSDLHGIPFMESHGFTTVFNTKDIKAGRVTPDYVPHDPVGFVNKNIRITKSCKWVDNVNDNFRTLHTVWYVSVKDNPITWTEMGRMYNSLEEVLEDYLGITNK